MKLLILAGGYGTRLYPLVKDIPKALLEVAGNSLIGHTLEKFRAVRNIDEVLVVTNAKFCDLLSSWAAKEQAFPVRVINDGTKTPEERLGAMGDIAFVLEEIGMNSDLVVVGSDNLFDADLAAFFAAAASRKTSPTVGLYDISNAGMASKYGVVQLDTQDKIISLEEKPEHPRSTLISMCLYYFPSSTLPQIASFLQATGKTDTTGGYIQWLYKQIDVYGFKFGGRWYDIGSLESYAEAQDNFIK